MANVNIPPNSDDRKNTRQQSTRKNPQKNYQQALSYERSFLKKKQELEQSATVKQLQKEIKAIQDRAAVELQTANSVCRSKTELEAELSRIQLKLASELSQKQLELLSVQRSNEYAAHRFAVACSMKAFQTQNVHQRAQTAAALADAQKVQTEKLRNIRTAQIEELKSQRKVGMSEEERRKINLDIRKLRREIASAEAEETKYQQQAVEYAQIVKRVDFERLSAAEKLAAKQKEVKDLQREADEAVAEIDSRIEAKKLDASAADASGDTASVASINTEIEQLRAELAATKNEYQAAIDSLTDSIDGADGFRAQAEREQGAPTHSASSSKVGATPADSLIDQDTTAQIAQLLNGLTNFVSAFETYVDTLDAKLTTDRALDAINAALNSNSGTVAKASSENAVSHLKTLIEQSTTDDLTLQAELSDRLTRLGSILDDSSMLDIAEDLTKLLSQVKPQERSKPELKTANSILREQRESKEFDQAQSKENFMASLLSLKETFTTSEGRMALALDTAMKAVGNTLKLLEDVTKSIDTNVNEYFQYQAQLDARLQGTEQTYKDLLSTVSNNLGMSMVVAQKDYISQFKKLVDSGIMHNMETRAFLATVTDKVISTFDAFDANLLRLVRLQQNDSTAARMGLESSLNKLFNSYFSDSSYLSDGPHDSISSAILEASSMLSNEMSLEFEFAVHKWLGALHSLGMSSDTLETIAQGLNYLGTGNVTALNGNDSLQTLLAMSAVHGGVSYADLLTNGLNAESTNKLLSGMITYLMQIANNTETNQVTKSAYSDLFGLHMSDLRAIINLTETDVSSLTELTTSYANALNETQTQINSIVSRTHLSTMVDTLFDNAVLGASLDIGRDPVAYGLWKTLNLVEGLTGGIALPFINIFGSGIDLNTTVTQLAKSGMAGITLLSNLVASLGRGGLTGNLDLANWGNVELTSRGSATKFLTTGADSGFSTSSRIDYTGSGSSDDIKRTEMSDAADSAEKDSEISNKNVQTEQDVPTQILASTQSIWEALASQDTTLLEETISIHDTLRKNLSSLSVLGNIDKLLAPSRVFLTSGLLDSGFTTGELRIDRTTGNVVVNSYDSQVSRLQNITSLFTDIVGNHSTSLLSANVDIWSLINSVDNLTNRSEMINKLSEQYVTDSSGFSNFSGDSKNQSANSTLISNLVTSINRSSNKTQLVEELKQMAEVQTLNKVVFPDYVRATVDELSPAVKKFIEELLKRAVDASVNGTDMSADMDILGFGEEQSHPIVRQLKAMLNDPSTVVNTREALF